MKLKWAGLKDEIDVFIEPNSTRGCWHRFSRAQTLIQVEGGNSRPHLLLWRILHRTTTIDFSCIKHQRFS
jgi:hypothetical protein